MNDLATETISRWKRTWHAVRRFGGDFLHGFLNNDLGNLTNSITYQILYTFMPFFLAGLALLGFLKLDTIWSEEVAPVLAGAISGRALDLINGAAETILYDQNQYWLTGGLVLAIWLTAGAVRVAMEAVNRIYHVEERRPAWRRFLLSFGLALVLIIGFWTALLLLYGVPELLKALRLQPQLRIAAEAIRWGVSLGVLLLVLLVFLRKGPARPLSLRRRWLTALAIVGGWLLFAAGFRWYVLNVARYSSIFGSLATVVVLMSFLHFSVLVLFAGLQADAVVRGHRRQRE